MINMELYSMTYKLEKNQTNLRILGKEFVNNNKNKGFLIIDNKKMHLKEIVQIKKSKIYMMLNKNIYNKNCLFKNCNLLESFSKIIPDDDIPKMNNIENDINYDFYSQNKINIIGNNNSFDYWGAGSESSKYSTIPEHSLKDEENLYDYSKK